MQRQDVSLSKSEEDPIHHVHHAPYNSAILGWPCHHWLLQVADEATYPPDAVLLR